MCRVSIVKICFFFVVLIEKFDEMLIKKKEMKLYITSWENDLKCRVSYRLDSL